MRNGDRWQVLARKEDDSLLVDDMVGRGRVVLPGEYVALDVALAYAVTIHKTQGLTADESILLVDEATTAEGLYVGMTRGRSSNLVLAVCDEADIEHRPPGPRAAKPRWWRLPWVRSAAEVAALEALREAFARSEWLAILAPRLANLNAQLARETPPDRSKELQWATESLALARHECRPGHLTRNGREDRRRLEAAEARCADLVNLEQHRQAWLDAHADTFAYRDELAEAVATRRHELGVSAAITQPDHVVDLIGPGPHRDREATSTRIKRASWIESYREEWGVEPERLRERPLDACQGQEWDLAVRLSEVLARPLAPTVDRRRDYGLGAGHRPGLVTGGAGNQKPALGELRLHCSSSMPGALEGSLRRLPAALDRPSPKVQTLWWAGFRKSGPGHQIRCGFVSGATWALAGKSSTCHHQDQEDGVQRI